MNNTIFLVYGFLNLTRYHITNVCSRVMSNFNTEKKNVLKSSYFEDVIKNSHLITHVDFLNSILSCDKDTFKKMIDSSGMFTEYFTVVRKPRTLKKLSNYEMFASDMLSFLIKNDITRGYLDATLKISIEPGCLDTFFRFMLISAFSRRMIFIISAVLKQRNQSRFLELVDDVLRGNDKLFFDTVNGNSTIISGIIEQLTYDNVNYVLEYLGTLSFNYKSGQNNQNIQNNTTGINQSNQSNQFQFENEGENENTNSTCDNRNIDNLNLGFDENLDYVENLDWNNLDTNNMLVTNAFEQNSANINYNPNYSPRHTIDNILFSKNNPTNIYNNVYSNNCENFNNITPSINNVNHTPRSNYGNYNNNSSYNNYNGMFNFNNPSNVTNNTSDNNIQHPENYYNVNHF
ncbi:unnamed protein product [Brachionus calyciflorus]|uniref:Uncharacterized protein n=1 Tax=Brachionus calyciflorus TaxID=104777 RepID=A0A813VMH1_9BILA|nr:unnamed protein product [Brachionus calyciflorus]